MDSKRFSGHHTKNLFSGRPTKAGIYFTDRAEGYPFVRRYPYRMLRRATWLKAASCLPPDTPPFLPSFLLSFSHLPFHRVLRIEYLIRHARKYSLPPNVIDSHFSGNGGRERGKFHFPRGFLSSSTGDESTNSHR